MVDDHQVLQIGAEIALQVFSGDGRRTPQRVQRGYQIRRVSISSYGHLHVVTAATLFVEAQNAVFCARLEREWPADQRAWR